MKRSSTTQLTAKPRWWKDPVTVSTMIIAIATAINVWISSRLWDIISKQLEQSRKELTISQRPYIGAVPDTIMRDDSKQILKFVFSFSNYGSSPGRNVNLRWEMLINSVIQPSITKYTQKNDVLFPGEKALGVGPSPKEHHTGIMNGTSILEVKTYATYEDSLEGKYHCNKTFRYDSEFNTFAVIDADCN